MQTNNIEIPQSLEPIFRFIMRPAGKATRISAIFFLVVSCLSLIGISFVCFNHEIRDTLLCYRPLQILLLLAIISTVMIVFSNYGMAINMVSGKSVDLKINSIGASMMLISAALLLIMANGINMHNIFEANKISPVTKHMGIKLHYINKYLDTIFPSNFFTYEPENEDRANMIVKLVQTSDSDLCNVKILPKERCGDHKNTW